MSADATPEDVLEGRARWCVVRGDSMDLLARLPPKCVEAVITDPPYSSGGLFRGDRAKSSGTTGVGALLEGRRVIMVEMVPEIADVAIARCREIE